MSGLPEQIGNKKTDAPSSVEGLENTSNDSQSPNNGNLINTHASNETLKTLNALLSNASENTSPTDTSKAPPAAPATKPTLGSGDIPMPPYPNDDPKYKPQFDPNYGIPPGPHEGANKIRVYFNNWLNVIRKNQEDPIAVLGLFQWLANLQKSGNPAVADMLKEMKDLKGANGQSFGDLVTQILEQTWFYEDGSSDPSARSKDVKVKLYQLLSYVQGIPGDSSGFFAQTAKDIRKAITDLPKWIKNNSETGKPGTAQVSKDWYWDLRYKSVLDFFNNNPSAQSISHKAFMDMVDKIIAKYHNNIGLFVTLIFDTFGTAMNERLEDIGANGKLSKALADITSQISDIGNIFAAAGTKEGIAPPDPTGGNNQLKHLLDDIKKLEWHLDNQSAYFGSALDKQAHAALDLILNTNVTIQGKPNIHTLQDMLDNESTLTNADWTDAANDLTDSEVWFKQGDGTAGKAASGPTLAFNHIQSELKGLTSAVSSQSQVVQTKIQQLSQDVQTLESMIHTLTTKDYSQNLLGGMVRNQIPH